MPSREIIYADLSLCQPSAALAWESRPGCWRLVDYETDDGLKGVMVFARPEYKASVLALPLAARGPHKIFLGVNYTKSEYGDKIHNSKYSRYGELEVKLSSDPGFWRVAAEQAYAVDIEDAGESRLGAGKRINRTIQEAYWRTADLDGHTLFFQPASAPYNRLDDIAGVANLSYVRLVALTPEEAAAWRARESARSKTRRLAQLWCGGMLSGHLQGSLEHHPTSLEFFQNEIACCAGSDIGIFSAELIRGSYCCFNSKTGDVGASGIWQPEWVDPLAAFAELSHAQGMKFFVGMRMSGGVYPMIIDPIGRARFFWEHPQWAKRDREGTPTTNLSLAYPEVRDYWLTLLREALAYDVNGVTIYLHRFYPFTLYEDPVVEAFQAQYGDDPRQLAEDDPRWLQHSAGYVTAFLRQIRQLVDEKPDRELAVTFPGQAVVYDTVADYEPLRYGADVTTWIKEGLADYLFPMIGVPLDTLRAWRTLGGDQLHIWPDLPRAAAGSKFTALAQAYYAAGADGLALNDGERRSPRLSEWAAERELGDAASLAALGADTASYYRRVPIKKMLGFNTRYSFNNFGGHG